MMKRYNLWRFLSKVGIIWLSLLLIAVGAWAQEGVVLTEAIAANQVRVDIKGRASTFIEPMVVMEASNLTDQALTILVPVGAILSSTQGNYCDLVVLHATPEPVYFVGRSSVPLIFQLYAYCLEPVDDAKRFPTVEARYLPTGTLAPANVIETLHNIQREQGQATFAAQLAVWSVASGKSLTELQDEMRADYSLYAPMVDKYLDVASAQTPDTTVTSTTLEPTLPATGLPPATVAPTPVTPPPSSNASWFWLLAVGIGIVGLALLAASLGLFSRTPKAVSQEHPPSPRAVSYPPASPSSSAPPKGRDPVTLGNKPQAHEHTEPIRISTPKASDHSVSSSDVQKKGVSQASSASSTPKKPELQPVVHEQTEPIHVMIHPPTDPLPTPENSEDWLTLKVVAGDCQGQEYALPGLEGIISRGITGQVPIQDTKVSSPHAILDISSSHGGTDRVRDLGSTNGTTLNGVRLPPNEWRPLKDDDLLQFGMVKMRYQQAQRQLVYEDAPGTKPCLLIGNNRWLVTHRELPFVEFESHDRSISVPHAYIRCERGRLEVRDLSSGGGVFIQEKRIKGRELIFNEEHIRVGKNTEFQVVTNIKALPDEIGEWVRLSWRGGGGMADVYRVRHKQTGEIGALKIPNPSKYRLNNKLGEEYRRLFKRERELAQKVVHPHLVEVREVNELPDSDLPYLVTDYVDGPSLDEALDRVSEISPADVAEIVAQVGRALKVLHVQHRYAHCDIKPGNILLGKLSNPAPGNTALNDGIKAYLTDLGIATPIGEKSTGFGVREYLPPEVVDGGLPVGVETDIYSLGQMMRFMLTPDSRSVIASEAEPKFEQESRMTNRLPATGPTTNRPATVLMNLAKAGGACADLARIIQKCIAPKPEDRYHHVEDLLQALEPLRAGADLPALVARTGWKMSTL